MSGREPIVVLDGPAGAGKSTVAREVAKRSGLPFLDTGAIYRTITLTMMRGRVPAEDTPELRARLSSSRIEITGGAIALDGEDVSAAIRTPEVDAAVSAYSAIPFVRSSLLELQRAQAKSGVVAEGRDMGTVVFPDADVKIFLTASSEERARRRVSERAAKGEQSDYAATLEAIVRRDALDSSRDTAPLVAAPDATVIDTTGLDFEAVVSRVLALIKGAGF